MNAFIRPSKRGWMMAVNALIWYLIARINHNLIALFLAWGSLALLLCGFFAAFCALRKVRIRRGQAADAQAGRFFNLPLVLDNQGWRTTQTIAACETLPFADIPDSVTPIPPLRGHRSQSIERQVMPLRRGEYRLESVTLRDADPIGLFLRERVFPLQTNIIIHPAFFPIEDLELPLKETFAVTSAMSPVALSGNSQDFYGVREYNPSDGMKHIHWKSSARFRKFMVREYERSAALPVAILVDADEGHVTWRTAANLECNVSLAASVVQYLRNVRCNITFASGGDSIRYQPAMPSPGVLPTLMYDLAVLKPGPIKFPIIADELLQATAPGAIIFAFTMSADDAVRNSINHLRERGYDVRWLVALPQDFARKQGRTQKSQQTRDVLATFVTPDMTSANLFAQISSSIDKETR